MNQLLSKLPNYEGLPAVALETTIISHGMPFPKNVETALAVEDEIRKAGGIPVTIGIIDGEIKIGMTKDEILEFGKRHDVMKCSRRDLAYCVANKLTGATTVAATMMLAHLAGIKIFATGGIGGVHVGGETSLDISADLEEFSRSPVSVVCAGPKAILDVGRTLEYLETKGVPVMTYKSDTIPLFYTASSAYPSLMRVESPEEIARILKTSEALGFSQASLICNPIPQEYSLDPAHLAQNINDDLFKEMEKQGIKGKDVTPYLLKKVVELTDGKSLEANIALIKNNAYLAGQIAKSLFSELK